MAVLIEAISVVVPVSVLEEKYPGGLDAYERDCPNRTFCCDGKLTRVGFMTPPDVGAFITGLERKGLEPFAAGCWKDVAVVDQQSGQSTAPCDWLAGGRKFDGPVFALLKEDKNKQIDIYLPAGWQFEGSLSQQYNYVPVEEASERLEFLRSEGTIDYYRDRETGKEVTIGRTSGSKNPASSVGEPN
jgi:hypothetical protein